MAVFGSEARRKFRVRIVFQAAWRPACLMDSAFAFRATKPAPGSGFRIWRAWRGAGRAADRIIAIIKQGMSRQIEELKGILDILLTPVRQRIKADAAVDRLDISQFGALTTLRAFTSSNPCVETRKRTLEGQHLA